VVPIFIHAESHVVCVSIDVVIVCYWRIIPNSITVVAGCAWSSACINEKASGRAIIASRTGDRYICAFRAEETDGADRRRCHTS
jgi:hypothetical protein